MRGFDDLHLITLASALLVGTVFVLPDSPVRIALGLPFVLFFPGYALIAALYPHREDLDGVERLALSLGLSLAVVPLMGLMLNFLPWGIRLGPILVALTSFIAICSIMAERRRLRLPRAERFCIEIAPLMAQVRRVSWPAVAVVAVLAASVAVAAWRLHAAAPRTGETFTEFYVLGPSGRTEGYPDRVRVGAPIDVILGIINHEFRRATYRIAIRTGDRTLKALGPVTLDSGQKWEEAVRFSLAPPAGRERVDFLLFKDDAPPAYRRLHLWTVVLPP